MANKAQEQVKITTKYSYSGASSNSATSTLSFGPYTASGVAQPYFRNLIANHLSATTSYTRTGIDGYKRAYLSAYDSVPVRDVQGRIIRYSETHGQAAMFPPDTAFAMPFDQGLYDRVAGIMRAKIAKSTPQFQSLVPMAEIGELRGTIRGLTYATHNMVAAMIELKRGRLKNFHEAAKHASDIWLTFSFGVRPMLNDIDALSKQIADTLYAKHGNITVGTTQSKNWVSQGTAHGTKVALYANARGVPRYSHELTYRCSAGINPVITSGNNYTAVNDYGLGLNFAVPALWNVYPYSWVVDYFSTVGDYLEDTFIGTPGNTVYCSLTQTYKRLMICDYSQDLRSLPSGGVGFCSNGSAFMRIYQTTRSSLPAIPARSLRFKTADEIAQGGVSKLLNLAALLPGKVNYH